MRRGLRGLMVGVGLSGVLLVSASSASAQAADPAKPVLTLDGDAAMITILIKPDKTADFEAVLAKYREAFEKSEKAERKQQLAGLKFFKSSTPGPQNAAIYYIIADPVVKDQEYDITRIVNEVFPSEVQEVFAKYKDSFAGRAIAPLSKK